MNRPEDTAVGYMGDPGRGAQLGRPTLDGGYTVTGTHPMILRKVRLNSGGYDQGGAYWGINTRGCGFASDAAGDCSILYYFEGPVTDISGYVRAADREGAKAEVRKLHPKARFYR